MTATDDPGSFGGVPLGAIIEQLPVGVGVIDTEGRFVQANSLMREFVPRNVIPSRDPEQLERWQAVDPQNHPLPLDQWPGERALRGETVSPAIEFCVTDEQGSERSVLVSAIPLRSPEGAIVGAVATAQDITVRRSVQEALRDSERRLNLALDSGQMGMWEWDVRNSRSVWNAKEYELLGLPVGDGREPTSRFFDSVHPDDLPSLHRGLAAVMQEGTDWRDECRILRPDGEERWLAAVGRVFRDPAGRVERMIGVNYDITERKRVEAERQKFVSLVEHSAEFIGLADLEFRPLYLNEAGRRMVGFDSFEETKRHVVQDYLFPEDLPFAIEEFLPRVLREGSAETEIRFRHFKTGEPIWVIWNVFRVLGEDGSPVGYATASHDITERKRSEEALRELNDTLEQRVAQRTDEVRRKANQLRALAAQLSRTEQRERKRLAKILHDHIQQLLVAARMQLESMRTASPPERIHEVAQGVDSILEEAVQASRDLTMDLSPPVLHESGLVAGLHWLAARMQEKHRLAVQLRTDGSAEPRLEETRMLLFECVRELLFNIVKHAGVSEAEIALTRAPGGEIQLVVADRGRGADPDVLDGRGSSPATFGLFSIQERIAYIGGRMGIETAPGRGTRITLLVPEGPVPAVAPAETPDARAAEAEEGGGPAALRKERALRVLIVDDHEILRTGLVGLLQSEPDIDIAGEAADGPSAVRLAQRTEPDVVVMDVSLTAEMNGIEATRRILAAHPGTRVIGLSMYDDPDFARSMCDAGAEAYLTKGGPSDDLIAAIRAPRTA